MPPLPPTPIPAPPLNIPMKPMASQISDSKYYAIGIGALVISIGAIFIFAGTTGSPILGGSYWVVAAAIIPYLFKVLIVHMATRWMKVPGYSFSKAFAVVGLSSLPVILNPFAGKIFEVPILAWTIASWVLSVVIFIIASKKIYSIKTGKAVTLFISQVIAGIVIGGILGIVAASFIFGAFN